MWESVGIGHGDVGEFHVQVLVDRVQRAADTEIRIFLKKSFKYTFRNSCKIFITS